VGDCPFAHKGPARDWKFSTNNCPSEEVAAKPSFRDALKTWRCIIPVSGSCEYTGPKDRMTKHSITRAGGGPLFLAGFWASHAWEGERAESYTMVMMEAQSGDDMHPFHNRQPVRWIPEGARTWLDTSAPYQAILKAGPPESLAFDAPEPVAA
jgi:putative SOS response-associated peptidase YedK